LHRQSTTAGTQGRYKEGKNRYQSSIGQCLDEQIDQNSEVRLIDLFVDGLDLKQLGFAHSKAPDSSGRPPYHPSVLLKLYLYGYHNDIRSGRKLARACQINLEVMWLLEELSPGYRTINTFRSDNSKALTATHEKFVLLCQELKLVGGSRCSIDGSHFKGNVSAKSFITQKGLKAKQAKARAEVVRWQTLLDEAQADESPESSVREIDVEQAKQEIDKLNQEQQCVDAQLEELRAQGKTQLSRTDPDARLLRKGLQGTRGYNVQIASDHKHYLIVGDAVTSEATDAHQLHPIAQVVKQRLGLLNVEVVADKGYYGAKAIYDCVQDKITPYVAIPKPRSLKESQSRYERSEFIYDEDNDVYRCPAGELLKRSAVKGPVGSHCYRSKPACRVCDHQKRCLSAKGKYREIWRSENHKQVQEHAQRMQSHPEIYAERAGAVEHPFGTLKRRAGWSHFSLRGIEKVRGEWSLMLLCYNFTRVLNVLGFDELKRILEERVKARLWIIFMCAISAIDSRFGCTKRQAVFNTVKISQALRPATHQGLLVRGIH